MAPSVSVKGYITLMSVLIVSVIGVAIGVSLILLGLGSARTSFALEQSNQAKALADACAEEALQQIRDNPAFFGSGNLALDQGNCDYNVQSLGGENRLITASGSVGNIIRKVSLNINQINPQINIGSWQAVADF